MPEGHPEGPRQEEESYVINPMKAEAMAFAEDPYQTMASNAEKAGMDDFAKEMRLQASTKGEAKGVEYDKSDKDIISWVTDKAKETATFLADDKVSSVDILNKHVTNPMLEQAIDKFYVVLGVEPSTTAQRDLAASKNENITSKTQLGIWLHEGRWFQDYDGASKPIVTLRLSKTEHETDGV